jgi:predicted phage terminase large subunit-like protein
MILIQQDWRKELEEKVKKAKIKEIENEIKNRKEQFNAKDNLKLYAKQAWHVVEPMTDFVDNWHIDAICEHLEAVTNGEIRKLLINVPPRHMKSILVSVFWMTWSWIKKPSLRWIYTSYDGALSVRDSLKCRRIIQSSWYQQRWGDNFSLAEDQNLKTRFENDKTGYRIATSVTAGSTGKGGDIIIADDPHNVQESRSDVKREGALIWWDEIMSTRLNDPKTGARVIIMQRIHENDLSGHVLEQGGYEHLCLPAEYEPDRKCITSIGFEDPRKEPGELLWPTRFGIKEIEDKKRELGSYAYAGQMQQNPQPAGGGMFKQSYFKYYKEEKGSFILYVDDKKKKRVPKSKCKFFQTIDTALKDKEVNDYTVIGTWGLTPDNELLLYNIYRDRIEVPDQWPTIKKYRTKYENGLLFQSVEDKASGTGIIQTARREGKPLKKLKADTDKVSRAFDISLMYENGMVYHLLNASWLTDFEDELTKFPKGKYDDQVDVSSYAGILVAQGKVKRKSRSFAATV